jgi:formylglycine-generating enzyme required for sulfatase activity
MKDLGRRRWLGVWVTLTAFAGFGLSAPQAKSADAAVGAAMRDCSDACPEMVRVPAGRFLMGSPASEARRDLDESPLHEVDIRRGFWVGRYAVTVGEFAAFVKATGFDTGGRCNEKAGLSWRDPGYPVSDTSPVVCVDYADAVAYTTWLSKKTAHRYRLLSEAEYEYVDRAGSRTAYWWGPEVGVGHANCKNCGSAWDNTRTAPVGSFPPNPFGLYDTKGNVYQWVADCWNPRYDNARGDGAPNMNGDCTRRGLRGGGWGSPAEHVRAAFRLADPFGNRYDNMGFRVARDLH